MSGQDLVTILEDAGKTARDAAIQMSQKKVGAVIVINRKGDPRGIITERDLIKKVCSKNLSADRIDIEEIMSSPLLTVMSYDSVEVASMVMTKNRIKRLGVMEPDNRLSGMLSVSDITKHLAKILLDDYNRYRSLKFAIDLSR